MSLNNFSCNLQRSEEPPEDYRHGPYVKPELRKSMGLEEEDVYEPDPRDFMDDEDEEEKDEL